MLAPNVYFIAATIGVGLLNQFSLPCKQNTMKYKKILSLVAVSAASLFAFELFAQDSSVSKGEYNRADSVQSVYDRDQAQTQKATDAEKMTDAKNEQVETKAKQKEAQRVENEADDAAKQSKDAVKTEKKAQKLRKKADKQAKEAEAARDKSDLN